MASFTAIKVNTREAFEETLPFNPLIEGWRYIGANCCEVSFINKDGVRLRIDTEHGEMRIVKRLIVIKVLKIPNNQLEFLIKTHGADFSS